MKDALVPVYTTTLVGRARETAEVVELLNDTTIQLVTLTGASGTGKTRLSMEITTALRNNDHTVLFIPLAAITNPSYVLSAVAHDLGVRESGSVSLIEQMVNYLADNPMIIILDNFEQVLAAGRELQQLLQASPSLKIIVTSQVPLNIEGETIYTIPGLDVPDGTPATPEEALQCAAIQLFVQRIQDVQPSFQFTTANIEPVVDICRLLEGLPLAIEIVAAHSGVLLPRDLKLLVKQHLMLYRFRAKQATGRQRILLPIIEWSLSRLPTHAQELFNHLGVFHGGWMYDALDAVVEEQSYDMEPALNLLAERHLILKQTIDENLIRYVMLDAVQDFANTRFQQLPSSERSSLIQRHSNFLKELTAKAQTEMMGGGDQRKWMHRIEQEMPNVRFLLELTIESAPQEAIDLIKNMGRFWFIGGYWNEGSNWNKRALASPEMSNADRALVCAHQCTLLQSLGYADETEACGHAGIEAAKSVGDMLSEGRIYNTLALVNIERQTYDVAQEYFEKALALAQKLDNQFLMAVSLGNLASINISQRDYDGALKRYEQARDVAKRSGQKLSEVISDCNIGCVYVMKREPQAALEPFDVALVEADKLQAKDLYGATLYFKAGALLMLNQPGAAALLSESLQILYSIGSASHIYYALEKSAVWLEQQGKLDAAGKVVGAVDQMRETSQILRDSDNADPLFNDLLERIKDSDVFEQSRQEGKNWSKDQTVDFVLDHLKGIAVA